MKQMVILVLFINVVAQVEAQTLISGKISNTKNAPGNTARVTINETGTGT
jgi:hypothetical protein